MRIYQFGQALLDRFVPMDEMTKAELNSEAATQYGSAKDKALKLKKEIEDVKEFNATYAKEIESGEVKAKQAPTTTVKDKVMLLLENWMVRYALAVLLILVIPKIKAYINGETSDEPDEDDADDIASQYEQFKQFQRLSKSSM